MKWSILVISFCGFFVPVFADKNSGQLQHNPFRQPKVIIEPRNTKTPANTRSEAPLELDLRAIIVSKSMPMVNLGGKIITVGEEIDGLLLVSVSPGEAVFLLNGVKHTLVIGSNKLEKR